MNYMLDIINQIKNSSYVVGIIDEIKKKSYDQASYESLNAALALKHQKVGV